MTPRERAAHLNLLSSLAVQGPLSDAVCLAMARDIVAENHWMPWEELQISPLELCRAIHAAHQRRREE